MFDLSGFYYVSIARVTRLKRKLNAFIDIEFGFGLLKYDAI